MTASPPFIDRRTLHRNHPDWVVVTREGDQVRVHRFSSPADAQAFSAEWNTSTDTDTEETTP